MNKTKLLLPLIPLMMLPHPSFAAKIKNTFPNKLSQAWEGKYASDINELPTHELLPISESRMDQSDYAKAASWYGIMQAEFSLKSYKWLLENALVEDSNWAIKSLGALGILSGYSYNVQPSFKDGLYTREDRFYLKPRFTVKTVLEHIQPGESVVAELTPGFMLEYAFYRQYQDPKYALLSVPYFHRNLPYDSKHAIQGLKVGDVFQFRAHMNILIDAAHLSEFGSGGLASIAPYFLMTGGYEVHVMKLTETKVRLTVTGLRRQGGGLKASVGVLEDLDIVGVEIIDGGIKKTVGEDILSAKLETVKNRAFIADYTMDLKDPVAADAFDKALAQAREYDFTRIVNPRRQHDVAEAEVLSNLAAAESVYQSDLAVLKVGRVERLSSGRATSKSTGLPDFKIRIGNRLANIGYSNVSHAMIFDDSENNDLNTKKQLDTHHTSTEFNLFFSMFQIKNKRAFDRISNVTGDGKVPNIEPVSFVMAQERTDRNFSSSDLEKFHLNLERLLPMAQLKLPRIERKQKLRNVVTRIQTVFSTQALASIPALKAREIRAAYDAYLENMDKNGLGRNTHQHNAPVLKSQKQKVDDAIQFVSKRLEKAFDPSKSMDERFSILEGLRNSALFRKTGAGFLMFLLPHGLAEKLVRIDVEASGTDGAFNERYTSGPNELAELYYWLLHKEHLASDGHFNLRIQSESLK